MIFLHTVLLFAIIFQFVKLRATLKGRYFNLLILALIGFLQLGSIIAEIRYISGNFKYCLEFYLVAIGFSNITIVLCSLLFCYKYFATALQIYQVSKYQKLTTKLKEKMSLVFAVIVAVLVTLLLPIYLIVTIVLQVRGDWLGLAVFDRINVTLCTTVTAAVALGFLSSIVLLKLAKVQVVHESQMSMVDQLTIFSLYVLMFVSQILSIKVA